MKLRSLVKNVFFVVLFFTQSCCAIFEEFLSIEKAIVKNTTINRSLLGAGFVSFSIGMLSGYFSHDCEKGYNCEKIHFSNYIFFLTLVPIRIMFSTIKSPIFECLQESDIHDWHWIYDCCFGIFSIIAMGSPCSFGYLIFNKKTDNKG